MGPTSSLDLSFISSFYLSTHTILQFEGPIDVPWVHLSYPLSDISLSIIVEKVPYS